MASHSAKHSRDETPSLYIEEYVDVPIQNAPGVDYSCMATGSLSHWDPVDVQFISESQVQESEDPHCRIGASHGLNMERNRAKHLRDKTPSSYIEDIVDVPIQNSLEVDYTLLAIGPLSHWEPIDVQFVNESQVQEPEDPHCRISDIHVLNMERNKDVVMSNSSGKWTRVHISNSSIKNLVDVPIVSCSYMRTISQGIRIPVIPQDVAMGIRSAKWIRDQTTSSIEHLIDIPIQNAL